MADLDGQLVAVSSGSGIVYKATVYSKANHVYIVEPLWATARVSLTIHESWLKIATPYQIAEWRKATKGRNIEVSFDKWSEKISDDWNQKDWNQKDERL